MQGRVIPIGGYESQANDQGPRLWSPQYVVEPVSCHPLTDMSLMAGTRVLGRSDDAELNSRIRHATTHSSRALYMGTAIFSVYCSLITLAQTEVGAATISLLLMVPCTMLCLAAHVYDLVALTVKTFEFWFLSFLNAVGFVSLCSLYQDSRIAAVVVASGFCQTTFILDGNVYTRRLLFRSFALASPLIGGALVAIALQYTPRFRHTRIELGQGLTGDVADMAAHAYSTIGIFLSVKVVRSWRLIFPSKEAIKTIQCAVYYPQCHLVPMGRSKRIGELASSSTNGRATRLKLIDQDKSILVDSDCVLLSSIRSEEPGGCLAGIESLGYIGAVCTWVAFIWFVARSTPASTTQLALALASVLSTFVFVVIYVFHAPLVLLSRLLWSFDAWFVSFQFTIVTIGVCDALYWDARAVFVVSPWLWCRWIMILDTLTPVSRRRLNCRREFVRVVLLMLFAYPVILVHFIFYSETPRLRNRVLVKVSLFGSTVKMEIYSLLVSRVWTVWFWMSRFLRREMFRPTDAFKLLKFRVQYEVDSSETTFARPEEA